MEYTSLHLSEIDSLHTYMVSAYLRSLLFVWSSRPYISSMFGSWLLILHKKMVLFLSITSFICSLSNFLPLTISYRRIKLTICVNTKISYPMLLSCSLQDNNSWKQSLSWSSICFLGRSWSKNNSYFPSHSHWRRYGWGSWPLYSSSYLGYVGIFI